MKGHLVKRAEGSYSVVLDSGKDPNTGKRQQKWVTIQGRKADAERELARLLNEVHTGGFIEPAKLTVAEYLERWLKDYAEVNVSGKTFERYQSIVGQHLNPALGHLPLPKLRPLHIQAHYSQALRDGRKDGRPGGLTPQSVLHHHRILREALQQAVRWQLLARNPADAVEPPRPRPREVRAIDEAQTAWLLEVAEGTRLHLPIMLAVSAGLRRGEILGLRWADLDSQLGVLHIRRSVEQTRKAVCFKEPKSRQGWRTVALPALALEALQSHRQQQARHKALLGDDYQDGDLICCVEDGSLWKPSAFTSAYRDLLRRHKLPGLNFHALRHSHASQLLKAGADVHLVSRRLGHAKAGFTLSTYAHMLPGQDEEAARRVDVALRAAIEQRRPSAVM